MTDWDYVQVEMRCGRCNEPLAIGDPIQLTHISGVKRALVRCIECAGPPPANLSPFRLQMPPQRRDEPRRSKPVPPAEWMPYRDE